MKISNSVSLLRCLNFYSCKILLLQSLKIHTKNLNLNVWKQKKAQNLFLTRSSQCFKITEKVSFNIASEASYVYILSGQKLVQKPKMFNLASFGKPWSLRSNSVTRLVNFNRTKIGEKCQNSKIQMRHLGWFSNNVQPSRRLRRKLHFIP